LNFLKQDKKHESELSMQIGASTWIWTSPLTSADVERLAPHAAGMGFDLLELPVESPNDFDYYLGYHYQLTGSNLS